MKSREAKRLQKRIISSVLTGAMLLSTCSGAFAFGPLTSITNWWNGWFDNILGGNKVAPSMAVVEEIQAYTDETMYGTGLVEVEITYEKNVDLDDISADSYILEDRGSLSPDYGEIAIEDVKVKGQTVTLKVSGDTSATENNKLVYTGNDKEGSRERNAFGIYCTGAWYRDENGVIHYGKDDNDAYENNTTGMGYQVRECLELKLRHADEAEAEAACLANDKGEYNAKGLWNEIIDRQFGEGKFQDLYELAIPSSAAPATDGTGDDYVRGYYYVPKNYNPANGIVFTIQGQGISYWKLADGCDNAGTGFMYDSATDSWKDKGAIVVNIHDRSSAGKGEYTDYYDFVLDDVNVMKYFIDTYGVTGNIVIQGNSRGTNASSYIIKALAGQEYYRNSNSKNELVKLDKDVYDFEIDTFICNNGTFGGSNYSDADWAAIADTGMKVWCFDGEQDSNNIENVAKYTAALKGKQSSKWIEENVRLTGYASEIFSYWGESDHSVTRINGWYFDDAAYYGPDCEVVDGEIVYNTKLSDGDKYTLKGRGTAATNSKAGYEYTIYDDLFQVWALKVAESQNTSAKVKDIDYVASADIDFTQSAQMPLEGWYEKTLDSGRTVKMYFSEYAACRAYFTVVAVPAGVRDVVKWAENYNYTELMEERGEVLVILEPENMCWKDLETELAYVTEAMKFVNGNVNAEKVTLFTNYSTFYLVGYGTGAAALEAWSAENPILVDSQVFVGGTSAGSKYLSEVGAKTYDGTNTGGYDPGIADEEEFKQVMAEHGYEPELAARQDVPVPTWFAGCYAMNDSVKYWMKANDCVAIPTMNGIYWQAKNSDAFQTEYANDCTDSNHGISQVKVSLVAYADAYDVGDFLYQYSRYNVPFAYSNHLSERQDYTSIRVAAQKEAQSGGYLTDAQKVEYDEPITADSGVVYDSYYVLAREQGRVGKGVIESGIFASADDNNDGVLDAREYLMYIPDSAKGKEAPIVFQFPGNTQSVSVGFDSTQWWRVANDHGVIIVIMSEVYQNGNSAALTWKNSDMGYHAVRDILENDSSISIDWTRVYGSGHSMGSGQVQGFVRTHPEFFAAVASTSFGSTTNGDYTPVPVMLVNGHSDLPFLMPDLWGASQLQTWFKYLATANGLKVDTATPDNADEIIEGTNRTWLYTWNNQDEIPMVRWGQTYLREHNCYPAEIPMSWEFLSKYRFTEDGDRVYSESGFVTEGDEQEIVVKKASMADVESIQAYTDETMYGTGLVEVEITYKEGTNLSGITADSYVLEDRGSLNPDFGQIEIVEALVNGNVVTLVVSQDTAATANNKLVYTGNDKEGARERNALGIYCTGAWYRDENGVIRFGKDDNDAYENNTTGMGYQARATLELKLRHADETTTADLANDKGQYNEGGLWLETIDRQFGEGKFQNLYALQIPSSAAATTGDETGDAYVQGYYYIPENYDPANGIVFTIQGQGISYWKLADGCDNAGTGFMYDSATDSWKDNGAIVVNIHDRSSAGKGEYTKVYDYVIDDVNVMKYFIEKYNVTGNIVVQGNSRGTMASSAVIKALAGCEYPKNGSNSNGMVKLDKSVYNFEVDTFICNNGTLGSSYSASDWAAVAATGLKTWVFDGEQDSNNINTVATYKAALKAAGYSDEWIEENVRLTGYASEIFAYWGESDHSVTRINGWYFDDAAYYGPDCQVVNGEIVYNTKLADGDTYTLKARGTAATNGKAEYEYVVYDELFQDWALIPVEKVAPATDYDSIERLDHDYSQAAQQPLTGWFTKTVAEGRTVKVYMSEEASIRTYFTVVAVPDGVNTKTFLEEEGWFDVADEKGEALFILEPGANGWGTAQEEAEYLAAAMGFLSSASNANKVSLFSTYGEHYLVGYGKGAAALELWAAANPILVISQTYVDGESAGSEALTTVASTVYTGKSSNGDISDVLDETIAQVGISGELAPKDVPVPTYFINYAGSEAYWLNANDCVDKAVDGVYYQDIDSDGYATHYANEQLKAAGAEYGISKVEVSAEAANAAEIYDWMSDYTRYDTTFAYSNAIAPRLDYTSARVAAQQDAKDGEINETLSDGTEIWAQEDVAIEGHGTVQVGVIAFADNSGDGKNDPREYIMYIPEGFKGEELPAIMIFPGNTQTDSIFMDSTLWWQIAEEEGIVLVFICETYNNSPVSVSHKDSDVFYNSLITILEEQIDGEYAEIDFTRIYGTGQSAGSNASQGFAMTNPEFFAAVASTSAAPAVSSAATYQPIPSMMVTGQMDAGDMAKGFEANELQRWATYMLEVNGFDATFAADKATEVINVDSRHPELYSWSKTIDGVEVPLFQWAMCLLRPHNCYPSDMPMLWDFMEHFSFVVNEDGSITRYYSESAFEEDDAVEIVPEEDVVDFDSITKLDTDYSQAAQLPLTGRFSKTISEGRTVQVYIAPEASIRSYFTIVAVPDGVDTWKYLEEEGWIALADEKGEGLFVLEPGAEGWGSVAEEEAYVNAAIAFLKSPRNSSRITLFSTFGEFYVAAYGAACAPVEAWAAANPIFVISQAYIGGTTAGAEVLNAAGAVEYDGSNTSGYDAGFKTDEEFQAYLEKCGLSRIARKDVPVPTWFAGDYVATNASVSYWITANDAEWTPDANGVYHQVKTSDAIQTAWANSQLADAEYGIAQVKVTADTTVDAAAIYDFLSDWTRYDNTFAYSNALGLRLDYTAARVAAQQDAKDGVINSTLSDGTEVWAQENIVLAGHGTVQVGVIAFADNNRDGKDDPREYIAYIPEGYEGKELPVIIVYPGNSQTDSIFLDSTMWWKVAEDEGFVPVMVCETYSSATGVSHANADLFHQSLITLLGETVDGKLADLDFTRVYASGQSAGSMTSQGFVRTHPEFYAAVASTSGAQNSAGVNQPIPAMLIAGQSDLGNLLPDLWNSSTLQQWAEYLFQVNGLNATIGSPDDAHDFVNNRTNVYSWANSQDIDLVRYGQTLLRAHNCHPSEMPILWDFMKHFSMDENGIRYYSESAFEQDDAVVIEFEMEEEVVDFDSITKLDTDWSQAAQLPLTGRFFKTISEGRTVQVYIADTASIRSYFTIVAVPDGVDTWKYLEEEGWIALADEKGEGLFVLEPGAEGWGSVAEEEAYVNAAISFLKSGRAKTAVFTTFGEFYIAAYGAACAPVEAWAAANPTFVISQAYIGGTTAGADVLDAAGAPEYDGRNTSGYDAGFKTDEEFEKYLDIIGMSRIARKDVPVPTWFAGNYNATNASVTYWINANDAEWTPDANGVYHQVKTSDAIQTAWANSQLADAEYGIAQVKVTADTTVDAAAIYDFLSTWTRYDNTFAYANALGLRVDYSASRVAAQTEAKDGEIIATLSDGTEVLAQENVVVDGHGTFQVGIIAFNDNNGDGKNDPREYLAYVPAGYENEELPVVVIYPGMTQTDTIFMDSTMWWQVAEQEGFVAIVVSETYSSAVAIAHKDADLFQKALVAVMTETMDGKLADLDLTRVYGTGQSQGSMTTQGFTRSMPEYFAAIASTSGAPSGAGVGQPIPTMLIAGQSDLTNLLPDLWNSSSLQDWAEYLFEVNGLNATIGSPDDAHDFINNRTNVYSWANSQDIDLVRYGQTLMRAHNCHPSEMPILWDFMKHFSMDENGNRYYSESAFEQDDAVAIEFEKEISLNDVESIQAYTDETMYGTGVVEVEVTYKEGTDLSGITADSYVLEDRGSLNPDFGQIKIADVVVDGNVVTLIVSSGSAATANNKLVYTGNDKEGSRERNAFGIYCTGAWYRDVNGVLYYGRDDSDAYENNTTGMGYQARATLELKLRHVGETTTANLANDKGQYNEGGLWLETIDRQLGEDGFQNLYELQIPSTAAAATDGTGDAYVRGHYYIPENYDPANGIVFTLQGQGISYWQLPDGTNDVGTGFMYDSATYSWADKGAIVVNIHDRSSSGKGEYWDVYDFVLDDARVMQYFIDKYQITGNIVLQGNSRGTMASALLIKALAGQPYNPKNQAMGATNPETYTLPEDINFTVDAYICQNGSFGYSYDEEDWAAIAATGLKVWAFDGEQDSNNIETIATYTEIMTKAQGAEWAQENIRLTGLTSKLFYPWGESDHSATRINGWYFDDAAYYGPDLYIDENGEIVYNTKLADGDKYTLTGYGSGNVKADYEYTVYDELFQEWALIPVAIETEPEIVDVQALTVPGHFGQKLKAVMIEYSDVVDASKLTEETFQILSVSNNLTGEKAAAKIEKVYTNNVPEMADSGVAGKYVIVELNDFDKVGLVADTYYYLDAQGAQKSISVRKDIMGCYEISVLQAADVYGVNGEVISAASAKDVAIDQAKIEHDTLADFEYLFLNDEEANSYLKDFTFGNDNFEYSISSNTTKNDHQNLTESDLLGDLNEATLSGLGVRLWYHLPDNYDPAKEYPLFLYAHGTGESLTTATAGDGTELSNHGVHFNIGLVTGTWANTEDMGYEDVIVVTPQYYNGNSPREDGYERDDAFRVALCYALTEFAVDRDKVYVSGTSQGAGRTTALVRDCADYITAAIIQNGAYSSKLAPMENGLEMHEEIFQFAADNNVAMWFFQGVNDFISRPITSEVMYNAVVNLYTEAGKDADWLTDNVRYTYLNNKLFLDMNETSYHSTMKPTYRWYAQYNDELFHSMYSDAEDSLGAYFDTKYGHNDPNGYEGMIDWALSKNKSELNKEDAPYSDVNEDDWFFEDIKDAKDEGLLDGVAGDEFDPYGGTTRGAFVTVLWNKEGKPVVDGKDFPDVDPDAYYAKAIDWASGSKVVNGYDSGKFGPEDLVTREQIAVILYQYARYKGYDVSATTELNFSDASKVSSWAAKAVKWAVAEGLISGRDNGTLDPKATATRAEMVVIINAFEEAVG